MDAENSLAVRRHCLVPAAVRAEFIAAVNCLKAAAELPVTPGRSIRELSREESFEADLACALGSRIHEFWPLREQLAFLERIGGMSDAAKSVEIYAQVYQMFRQNHAGQEGPMRGVI